MKTAILVTPLAERFPVMDGADYIGVDAGVLHLLGQGIMPVLAVGDFDSMTSAQLEQIKNSIDIEKEPVMKAETDSQLALMLAKERGYEQIILAGAFGGRIDHTIANLRLMEYQDPSLILWDEGQIVFCLKSGVHALKNEYRNVSFFALEPTVLSLHGFLYPLEKRRIVPGDIYTISNSILDEEGTVIIESGSVLCIMTNK